MLNPNREIVKNLQNFQVDSNGIVNNLTVLFSKKNELTPEQSSEILDDLKRALIEVRPSLDYVDEFVNKQ